MVDIVLRGNADEVDLEVCWMACNLDENNCVAHIAPKKTRRNCTENPYCISRLGLETFEELAQSESEPEVTERRNSSRQPCGLTNAGNFCYVNSFLQIWFNDLKFRQCIYNWRPSDNWTMPQTAKLNIEDVMNCLQKLFIAMQFTPFKSTHAGELIEVLRLNNQQQDVQEFHTRFFDTLERNMESHPNGLPILNVIWKLFESRIDQDLSCAYCEWKSTTTSEHRSLQLSIALHDNLVSAIQAFFAEEMLNDFQCQSGKCKYSGHVSRTSKFVQLPQVLVIQLKRYVVGRNLRARKLQHAFHFPRILTGQQLRPGVAGVLDYKLCAVMIHRGKRMDAGHYYDIIYEPNIGKWFIYNDDIVTETTAPGYSGRLTNRTMTAAAGGCYALIYRKLGTGVQRGPMQAPPPKVLTEVENKLEEDFARKKNDDGTAFAVWKRLIGERSVWLRQLWTELEVHNGMAFLDRPEDISFLPTALLCDILDKELTAPVSAVAIPLCAHNRLRPGLFTRGTLKAVNTSAARRLIKEYNVNMTLQNGADFCLECVWKIRAHFVAEFRGPRLHGDVEDFFYPGGAFVYIKVQKNTDPEVVNRHAFMWISRRKRSKNLLKIKMCSDQTVDDLKWRIFETIHHPPANQTLYRVRSITQRRQTVRLPDVELQGDWTLETALVPPNNLDEPLILILQAQEGDEDEDKDKQSASTTDVKEYKEEQSACTNSPEEDESEESSGTSNGAGFEDSAL
uniref:Ubiquitin carboxyl-terminal hydrolase n=1 Tax=Globodera pallida TaxID=36090 RepID=A0A183BNQ4_GLOPA